MSRGLHVFKATEVKRAVRALLAAGLKIDRVTFEGGRFECITADHNPGAMRIDTPDEKATQA